MFRYQGIFFIFLFGGCIERFELPRANGLGSLVVDGSITDQNGPYVVRISNTKLLIGHSRPEPVVGALVMIEEEDGVSATLFETEPGLYQTNDGDILGQVGKRYRLSVRLSEGIEYQSPWERMLPTPEVDKIEVGFRQKSGKSGAELYLSTEDPTGEISFFRWEVIETWKYKVPYASRLIYGQSQLKSLDDFHETCWLNQNSTAVMLATVSDQTKNAVVHHPLVFVSGDSARLNVRYSALIRQYAISGEEYAFWKGLKSTNEDVGGLFDKQPFQVVSNVKRIGDEDATIFGYFRVNSIKEKRIYLNREDFPEDFLPQKTLSDCPLFDLSTATTETHNLFLDNGIYLFVYPDAFFTTQPCGDCEAYGGTTLEPTFWEE